MLEAKLDLRYEIGTARANVCVCCWTFLLFLTVTIHVILYKPLAFPFRLRATIVENPVLVTCVSYFQIYTVLNIVARDQIFLQLFNTFSDSIFVSFPKL